MKKYILVVILLLFIPFSSFSQTRDNSITLDFRNQKITDILLSLAEISGESIVFDETVTGSVSFFFSDVNFQTALTHFADYAKLHVENRNDIYYVSRIYLDFNTQQKLLSIDAEDVLTEHLLKSISRETETTIFYDTLPKVPPTM